MVKFSRKNSTRKNKNGFKVFKKNYKAKTSRKNKNNSKSSSTISSLTSSSHSSKNRGLSSLSSSSSLEDNILDMFNTMKNISFNGKNKGGRRKTRKHRK